MTNPTVRYLQFEVAVEITDPVAVRSATLKALDTETGEAPSLSDPFASVSEILRDRIFGSWQENAALGFQLGGNTTSMSDQTIFGPPHNPDQEPVAEDPTA